MGRARIANANVQNIISKAKQEPYQELILEMFQTSEKIPFHYDDSATNFLYMNGVVEQEVLKTSQEIQRYLKFPSPLVQKRLFNYFSSTLFRYVGKLYPPFKDLSDIISDKHLNIKKLMGLYEQYLRQNEEWLFKDAPRRTTDLRISPQACKAEAVYHFNLYMYLSSASKRRGGLVYPEFPTGNGKIDLIIKYAGQKYGLEVKSYADDTGYKHAIKQAARYGKQLQLSKISLLFFIGLLRNSRGKYTFFFI